MLVSPTTALFPTFSMRSKPSENDSLSLPSLSKRLFKVFALLCLMGSLTACNAFKASYNNGETLLRWWLDDYVDFQDSQDAPIRQVLSRQFTWHRSTQLPAYVPLLQRAKTLSQRPVTKAEVASLYNDARKFSYTTIEHFLPDVADLALTFTPAQLQTMEKKFAENNQKYRKKFQSGTREDQQEARFEKVIENAERLYGGFSGAQEEAIRKASDVRPLNATFIMAERVRRQKDLVAVLRKIQSEKPNRATAVEWLQRYVSNFEKPPTAERASYRNSGVDEGVDLAVTIANLTTPEQKQTAQKRLNGWLADIAALRAGK